MDSIFGSNKKSSKPKPKPNAKPSGGGGGGGGGGKGSVAAANQQQQQSKKSAQKEHKKSKQADKLKHLSHLLPPPSSANRNKKNKSVAAPAAAAMAGGGGAGDRVISPARLEQVLKKQRKKQLEASRNAKQISEQKVMQQLIKADPAAATISAIAAKAEAEAAANAAAAAAEAEAEADAEASDDDGGEDDQSEGGEHAADEAGDDFTAAGLKKPAKTSRAVSINNPYYVAYKQVVAKFPPNMNRIFEPGLDDTTRNSLFEALVCIDRPSPSLCGAELTRPVCLYCLLVRFTGRKCFARQSVRVGNPRCSCTVSDSVFRESNKQSNRCCIGCG